MIEFGEKVKKLREEKGMTQQTLSEQLYVTRQAVSRWECGARYPDLLTTKKIAQILEVSIDELVSGEELQRNVEREPVLAKPVENIFQTVLYTIAMIAYLLMSIFGVYSFFPSDSLKGTPAGQNSLLNIVTVFGYMQNCIVLIIGLIFSIKNKLTAKWTGLIMALPYVIVVITNICTYIEMQIKKNGNMTFGSIVEEIFVPCVFVACILIYFCLKEKRMSQYIIYAICLINFLWIVYVLKKSFYYITDLGFAVRSVHCLGKIGMIILLAYQAYVWEKKRTKGVKTVEF